MVAGKCSGLSVSFTDTGCGTANAPAISNTTWQQVTIPITSFGANCSGYRSLQFNLGQGNRFLLDTIQFLCSGTSCFPSKPPIYVTGTPGNPGNPTSPSSTATTVTPTVLTSLVFGVLLVFIWL